jgi:hypothetical protein
MLFSGVHKVLGGNSYWIDASDDLCEGRYMWCNTRKMLKDTTLMRKYFSPNGNPAENYLYLIYGLSPLSRVIDFMLDDQIPSQKFMFICEVI